MEKKITKILSEPNNIIHKLPIFDFEILLCLNEKIIPNGRKIIKYGNPSFTNDSNKLKTQENRNLCINSLNPLSLMKSE